MRGTKRMALLGSTVIMHEIHWGRYAAHGAWYGMRGTESAHSAGASGWPSPSSARPGVG